MSELMTERARGIQQGIKLLLDVLGGCEVDAQHDVIYAGGDGVDFMGEPARVKMRDWGWHWDDDFDCWAFFT